MSWKDQEYTFLHKAGVLRVKNSLMDKSGVAVSLAFHG